jgi:uncharacterized protein (TIGR03086 family)
MTSPIDRLATALPHTGELVDAIEPDQWPLPTPCPEWTVHGVAHHLVFGHLRFTAALTGGTPPPSDVDVLGADPGAAYRSSAEEMLAAFRADGALERPVTLPAGTLPGLVACELRVVEALVHGWDLARATGRPLEFPGDLVEQSLAFSRGQLGHVPADRRPFGPPRPVVETAPPLDRLAALLGRSVDGGPHGG